MAEPPRNWILTEVDFSMAFLGTGAKHLGGRFLLFLAKNKKQRLSEKSKMQKVKQIALKQSKNLLLLLCPTLDSA